MKNRTLLVYIVLLVFAFSCKETQEEKDPVKIGIDASISPFLTQQINVYESIYGPQNIEVTNYNEQELIQKLYSKELDIVIGVKKLTAGEKQRLQTEKRFWEQVVLFTDAVEIVGSKKSHIDSISLDSLSNWIAEGNTEHQLISIGQWNTLSRCVTKKIGVDSIHNHYFVQDNQEFINQIQKGNTLGLIATGDKDKFKSLKRIKIKSCDSCLAVYARQSTIYDQSYAFCREVIATYNGNKHSVAHEFIRFIRSTKGQRILLKDGHTPIELPSRQIVL